MTAIIGPRGPTGPQGPWPEGLEKTQPKEREARMVAEIQIGERKMRINAFASWREQTRNTGIPSVRPCIEVYGVRPTGSSPWLRTVEDFNDTPAFGQIMADSILREAGIDQEVSDEEVKALEVVLIEARRVAVKHALGAMCSRIIRMLSKEEVAKAMMEEEVHEVMEE